MWRPVEDSGVVLIKPIPELEESFKLNFEWHTRDIAGDPGGLGSQASYFQKTPPNSLRRTERIPVGVIYRKEMPTFEEQLPALSKGPLMRQRIEPGWIAGLLDEFL